MRMKSFSYQLLLPAGLFAIKLIDSLIEEVFVGLMDELIDYVQQIPCIALFLEGNSP